MPKLKYRPRRDIPLAARSLGTLSPTEISNWILNRFNVKRTPESISMWFKRHPEIYRQLKAEIEEIGLVPVTEAVSPTLFERGVFEEIPSIKNWIKLMVARGSVKPKTMRTRLNVLRNFCRGLKPHKNIDLKEHGWVLKHPDRLNLEDVYEWLRLMAEHYPEIDTSTERLVLRDFLKSKGIDVEYKISGRKHKSVGKYARLYVEMPILEKILDYIREVNYECYVVTLFMFYTGTRIGATLEARIENIRIEDDYIDIRVFDKGASGKYGLEGRPWDKFIPYELWEEMKIIIGDRTSGKIFSIEIDEVRKILRESYERVYPELLEKYPTLHVAHFWRHMFAQHMLRKTGWNYGVVAALGGWDVKSLEESYGKPPIAMLREWGRRFVVFEKEEEE